MFIEDIQKICLQLPGVTEEIKWGHDLVFSIGKKMFCVVGLEKNPVNASFKVNDEEFELLPEREGFIPAPYMARYKWIYVDDINRMGKKEWQKYLKQSYDLIYAKLPLKLRKEIEGKK